MKVAFDVHGVLDTHEEYRAMMRFMHNFGYEIYIISGQPLDEEMRALLNEHTLTEWYHYYFSVETYLLESGDETYEERPEGKFWPDASWDGVKARICEAHYIDMIFDNSPAYAATFKDIDTHFNLVIDKEMFNAEKLKGRLNIHRR